MYNHIGPANDFLNQSLVYKISLIIGYARIGHYLLTLWHQIQYPYSMPLLNKVHDQRFPNITCTANYQNLHILSPRFFIKSKRAVSRIIGSTSRPSSEHIQSNFTLRNGDSLILRIIPQKPCEGYDFSQTIADGTALGVNTTMLRLGEQELLRLV